MPRTIAAVVAVEIKDVRIGDKLHTDVVGYKGKVLIARGSVIGARELAFIGKKLKEGKPRLASTKYRTNLKAMGDIRAADGRVLVKRGEVVTEAAVAPLLKEGFSIQEMFENDSKLVYRKAEWTGLYHISEFNPFIHVERTELVNDDGSPLKNTAKTPAGAGAGGK